MKVKFRSIIPDAVITWGSREEHNRIIDGVHAIFGLEVIDELDPIEV
jgi:hypothetical protein